MRTVNELNVPPPQEAQIVRHYISPEEGIELNCDACKQAIVGPRIKCLNCPSTNVCLPCSSSQSRSREMTLYGHVLGHICTVVWNNETD